MVHVRVREWEDYLQRWLQNRLNYSNSGGRTAASNTHTQIPPPIVHIVHIHMYTASNVLCYANQSDITRVKTHVYVSVTNPPVCWQLDEWMNGWSESRQPCIPRLNSGAAYTHM